MLTEDDVIDAVRDHLMRHGWRIVARATATQRGYDLVAERRGRRLIVEAKGEGSSKERSARYGQSFNKGQVFDHVAKAILKALRVAAFGGNGAAVALPDNADHRHEIELVGDALDRLDVGVFFVREGGVVTLQASWSV
jgi:hypothetical protein